MEKFLELELRWLESNFFKTWIQFNAHEQEFQTSLDSSCA